MNTCKKCKYGIFVKIFLLRFFIPQVKISVLRTCADPIKEQHILVTISVRIEVSFFRVNGNYLKNGV